MINTYTKLVFVRSTARVTLYSTADRLLKRLGKVAAVCEYYNMYFQCRLIQKKNGCSKLVSVTSTTRVDVYRAANRMLNH